MHNHTVALSVAALLVGCSGSSTRKAPPAAAAEEPAPAEAAEPEVSRLAAAIAGDHRSDANRARDAFRNPEATLEFCGLQPTMTVLELAPGGGWYTEILAPTLKHEGTLIAGVQSADGSRAKYRQRFVEFQESNPELYGDIELATFDPPEVIDLGEPGSVDLVLTFRSAHGWVQNGAEADAFAAVYDVLRPGGVFCVVQHRAPESDESPVLERAKTGYVRQSYLIDVAEGTGFELDAASEINANPKDTTDHPEGVWTLPPGLRLGDEDRERYLEIGESDRMTLRFRKPEGGEPPAQGDEQP